MEYLYIIKEIDSVNYKIGRTYQIDNKLNGLQILNTNKLILVDKYQCKDCKILEKRVYNHLKDNLNNEWFNLSNEELDNTIELICKLVIEIHEKLNSNVCHVCNFCTYKNENFQKHLKSESHKQKIPNDPKTNNKNPISPNGDLICNICSYSSRDKFNYNKHLNTKKHKEKVTEISKGTLEEPLRNLCETSEIKSRENLNIFKCAHCDNCYSTSGSLARHKKVCGNYKTENNMNKYYEENQKLRMENQLIKIENLNLKNLVDEKEDKISILKSEVMHLKSLVNNAGNIIKTSVSTMSYVIKNYKDAPVLESVKDYSAIHYDKDNTEFVNNLIYEYNHNKLNAYIGDFIIKTYKKGDPSKQSIWNSDTNRLTYLIREIISTNKVDWKVDKKGIKTTKFIIEPILEYIDTQIREYVENFDIDYSSGSAKEAERKMMKLKSATDILKNIEDKVLSDEILKYIAPYFYLNKHDDSIEN